MLDPSPVWIGPTDRLPLPDPACRTNLAQVLHAVYASVWPHAQYAMCHVWDHVGDGVCCKQDAWLFQGMYCMQCLHWTSPMDWIWHGGVSLRDLSNPQTGPTCPIHPMGPMDLIPLVQTVVRFCPHSQLKAMGLHSCPGKRESLSAHV